MTKNIQAAVRMNLAAFGFVLPASACGNPAISDTKYDTIRVDRIGEGIGAARCGGQPLGDCLPPRVRFKTQGPLPA